ncbi:methyl-accepting chemotaxis protein [Modicisalibacter tunisiensis]|uniref:Tar ligand binding domain-containing protein n=1 Tax=Modicisalibacter tunisiensis TaxID=390637 RepID=A0ABS7WWQ1_9GAMM|nr:methyl-accepting chemotaxis protein [Modicisalibacter tunisiensis]MBZ9567042.1 Tar ligand binding domain-containing protein [Modicisalibacter tunisiensis]
MRNISVKQGLFTAFGLMALMVALIGGLGYYAHDVSSRGLNELAEINVEQVNTLNRTQVNLAQGQTRLVKFENFQQRGMEDQAQAWLEKAQRSFDQATARFAQFEQVDLPPNSERRPYVKAITDAYHQAISQPFLRALENGDAQALLANDDAFLASYGRFADAVDAFVHYAEKRGDTLIAEDASFAGLANGLGLALMGLAVVLFAAVMLAAKRWLLEPLDAAIAHCERIAEGDLTADIRTRRDNEIGQLYTAMAAMQAGLKQLVGTLKASSDTVATGAAEIAAGSEDLSSRTEQQASALQETASSMEQIASTVRQNTETAEQANNLSSTAADQAESGAGEVEQTVALMQEIESSSKQIGEIIEVIDSIAFQTNILALNASVEAARAGEHGRGFAVVASEVRTLATRTAESSREIRGMIEQISRTITSGSAQAGRSGEKIHEVVASIRRVAELIDELAMSAREQKAGVEQVGAAVTQMDSVTQQNASLVEETSAAAGSLRGESQRLAEMIARFRLEGGAAPARALPSAAADETRRATPVSQDAPTPRRRQTVADTGSDEPEWTEF